MLVISQQSDPAYIQEVEKGSESIRALVQQVQQEGHCQENRASQIGHICHRDQISISDN